MAPGSHDAFTHDLAPAIDTLQHVIIINVIIVIIAIVFITNVFITNINNIVFNTTHIFIIGAPNTNVSAGTTAAPLLAAAPIDAAAADKRSSRARRQRRAKTTCAGQTLQSPKPQRPTR